MEVSRMAKKKISKARGYSVLLDPDVVKGLKGFSEASSIPVVRLVNRILRDSLSNKKKASPAFVSAVNDLVEKMESITK
jgi:hypothetical protein